MTATAAIAELTGDIRRLDDLVGSFQGDPNESGGPDTGSVTSSSSPVLPRNPRVRGPDIWASTTSATGSVGVDSLQTSPGTFGESTMTQAGLETSAQEAFATSSGGNKGDGKPSLITVESAEGSIISEIVVIPDSPNAGDLLPSSSGSGSSSSGTPSGTSSATSSGTSSGTPLLSSRGSGSGSVSLISSSATVFNVKGSPVASPQTGKIYAAVEVKGGTTGSDGANPWQVKGNRETAKKASQGKSESKAWRDEHGKRGSSKDVQDYTLAGWSQGAKRGAKAAKTGHSKEKAVDKWGKSESTTKAWRDEHGKRGNNKDAQDHTPVGWLQDAKKGAKAAKTGHSKEKAVGKRGTGRELYASGGSQDSVLGHKSGAKESKGNKKVGSPRLSPTGSPSRKSFVYGTSSATSTLAPTSNVVTVTQKPGGKAVPISEASGLTPDVNENKDKEHPLKRQKNNGEGDNGTCPKSSSIVGSPSDEASAGSSSARTEPKMRSWQDDRPPADIVREKFMAKLRELAKSDDSDGGSRRNSVTDVSMGSGDVASGSLKAAVEQVRRERHPRKKNSVEPEERVACSPVSSEVQQAGIELMREVIGEHAMRTLMATGYKGGALGKDEDGILTPVEVNAYWGNYGVGYVEAMKGKGKAEDQQTPRYTLTDDEKSWGTAMGEKVRFLLKKQNAEYTKLGEVDFNQRIPATTTWDEEWGTHTLNQTVHEFLVPLSMSSQTARSTVTYTVSIPPRDVEEEIDGTTNVGVIFAIGPAGGDRYWSSYSSCDTYADGVRTHSKMLPAAMTSFLTKNIVIDVNFTGGSTAKWKNSVPRVVSLIFGTIQHALSLVATERGKGQKRKYIATGYSRGAAIWYGMYADPAERLAHEANKTGEDSTWPYVLPHPTDAPSKPPTMINPQYLGTGSNVPVYKGPRNGTLGKTYIMIDQMLLLAPYFPHETGKSGPIVGRIPQNLLESGVDIRVVIGKDDVDYGKASIAERKILEISRTLGRGRAVSMAEMINDRNRPAGAQYSDGQNNLWWNIVGTQTRGCVPLYWNLGKGKENGNVTHDNLPGVVWCVNRAGESLSDWLIDTSRQRIYEHVIKHIGAAGGRGDGVESDENFKYGNDRHKWALSSQYKEHNTLGWYAGEKNLEEWCVENALVTIPEEVRDDRDWN